MTFCEKCSHNHDGEIQIQHCTESICPVANSLAFRQLVEENKRLKAEMLVSDPQWREMVWDKASELIVLLSEGSGR